METDQNDETRYRVYDKKGKRSKGGTCPESFDWSFDSEGQTLRTFGGERSVEPLRLEELRINSKKKQALGTNLGKTK